MLLDNKDCYTKLLKKESEMKEPESNGVHKQKRVWPIWLIFAILAFAFNLRNWSSSEYAPVNVPAVLYCFFFYAGILVLPTKKPRITTVGLCPIFFLA